MSTNYQNAVESISALDRQIDALQKSFIECHYERNGTVTLTFSSDLSSDTISVITKVISNLLDEIRDKTISSMQAQIKKTALGVREEAQKIIDLITDLLETPETSKTEIVGYITTYPNGLMYWNYTKPTMESDGSYETSPRKRWDLLHVAKINDILVSTLYPNTVRELSNSKPDKPHLYEIYRNDTRALLE